MAEEIVREVLWTNTAEASFDKIVKYLNREWTEKEVAKFIQRTEDMIGALKCYPEIGRPSKKKKFVRIGILDKHTQLIYHYKPSSKTIKLFLFWGMKQNPAKLKY